MQEYKHDCVLCRELNGSKDTNFHRIYGEEYSRILCETDNFVLIPALGQLTHNQSMIVPKKHYLSMKGALEDFSEVQFLIDCYLNNFFTDKDEILFFENGNSTRTFSSCIEHAHLNILPIKFDFDQELMGFFDSSKHVIYNHDLKSLYHDLKKDTSYRVAGTYLNGFYAMQLDQKPESQFMRKKIAKLLEIDCWDWKNFGFQNSMYNLITKKKENNVL